MMSASIRDRFNIWFLLIVLLLPSAALSQAVPDLPENNLLYPVLLQSKEGSSGSGFFHQKGDGLYLVTARHVLFKETFLRIPERCAIPPSLSHKFRCVEDRKRRDFVLTFKGVMSKDDKEQLMKAALATDHANFKRAIGKVYGASQTLELRSAEMTLLSSVAGSSGGPHIHEVHLRLGALYKDGQIKYHGSHDVACVRIGTLSETSGQAHVKFVTGVIKKQGAGLVGLGEENYKLMEDVVVGNAVFVFGYPTSITRINPWLDIKLPLLRKGIIAGKNEVLKAIILDCPAFGGNSGGLVIEVERTPFTNVKYTAVGVVTNFVPYQRQWFENSGYSIVVPMDFVEELIARYN